MLGRFSGMADGTGVGSELADDELDDADAAEGANVWSVRERRCGVAMRRANRVESGIVRPERMREERLDSWGRRDGGRTRRGRGQ